jgi:hypothetical protein
MAGFRQSPGLDAFDPPPLNRVVSGMAKSPLTVFVLGIVSVTLGPLTGIPGIIIGRQMPARGMLGDLGYFLCWLFSILFIGAALIGFVAALTMPLWRR